MINRMRAGLAALALASASLTGLTSAPALADDGCPAATVSVSTPAGLAAALAGAQPGDSIRVGPGTYDGNWTASTAGTEAAPIWLCGTDAVLTNGGITGSYGLHLDGASWWHVRGLEVTAATKGIVVDNSVHVEIASNVIHDIGDEGIHLRTFTTDSLVADNTISATGQRRDKFGEGVYVGSTQGNWSVYTGGSADTSDRNIVQGNHIGPTTAEPIDVKEGTTAVQVLDNQLDGSGLTERGGDSCVDFKGNYGLVAGNSCVGVPAGDGDDAYQVHHNKLTRLGLGDWGLYNELANNTAAIGPGARYGFFVHDPTVTFNVVRCGQVVSGVTGYSNQACTP